MQDALRNYSRTARWLHWLTALLFLGSYLSVYYRHWFTEKQTPENWTALQLHLSIGVTIAVLVVLRILWRLSHPPPPLEPGTALEHRAAKAGHYLLYAVMILMPLSGYLGTGANTDYFFLFEIPKFEATAAFTQLVSEPFGLSFKEWEKPIDFFHKDCLLYTSPSPRDATLSRMPSSA